MEPVPEPALAADVAGETDAAGAGADGAPDAGPEAAGEPNADMGAEDNAEVAVDGRAAVVASTVVNGEVVVPVTLPDDAVEPDSRPAVEVVEVVGEMVDADVEVVEVVEIVEVVGDAVDRGDVVEVADEGIAIGYDALLAAAEQVLDDVDGALARLQDGTYGRCEVCDDGDDDRLAAEPTARTCERHLPLAHAS